MALPRFLASPLRSFARSAVATAGKVVGDGRGREPGTIARFVADIAQLSAINERLVNDRAQLEAINARLLSDQEKIKGHNDLLIRMRDWYAEAVDRLRAERDGLRPEPELSPKLVVGMISEMDVERLIALARQVPQGGLIVDIGSLMGQSTSVWTGYSQAATIVCVDPWKYESWMEEYATRAGPITREQFLKNVPDPRIETIQGYSPLCAEGWTRPIDLYWEDGDHNNPACADGVRFWSEFVKPGGIACGHDCHWPDVMSEAQALATRWRSEVEVFGSVWSVRRPSL